MIISLYFYFFFWCYIVIWCYIIYFVLYIHLISSLLTQSWSSAYSSLIQVRPERVQKRQHPVAGPRAPRKERRDGVEHAKEVAADLLRLCPPPRRLRDRYCYHGSRLTDFAKRRGLDMNV